MAKLFVSHSKNVPLKVQVQILGHIISEVLCDIYEVCVSTTRKAASPYLHVIKESIFKVPGTKIIFGCFYFENKSCHLSA